MMKFNLYRVSVLAMAVASSMVGSVEIASAQSLQIPQINPDALKNPQIPQVNLTSGKIGVRIFFGQQMGGHLPDSCSKVIVKVTTSNNTVVIQQPAQEGKKLGLVCLAILKNVPVGVPIKLTAEYLDLISTPSPNYKPPIGQWSNPLTLAPNEFIVKHLLIDGKP
ncbi:hypothetical protein I8748_22500 [Nostoc sp. CENA67]|uniref:Secreted protein n=1 Tax=Amazonocrinis nigriterrae CENA67 TaxID=2794033 RepID=A0A8J7L8X3_9NOST|nr:hypothetical protein [Amazonocrinis nigriterrae]MBH8564919.1 hypothetical protein [Amazonocrinis nigriterrae CENA67]